jgi:hypothetical protein
MAFVQSKSRWPSDCTSTHIVLPNESKAHLKRIAALFQGMKNALLASVNETHSHFNQTQKKRVFVPAIFHAAKWKWNRFRASSTPNLFAMEVIYSESSPLRI